MSFNEGSYFYSETKEENGEVFYSVFRCLKIDREFNVAHVAIFEPMESKPAPDSIKSLSLQMAHAPIDLDGFDNSTTFAEAPVDKAELDGYYAYLKYADFPAYLEETGADVDALAAEAEALFNKAASLADQENFQEAAELYYEAYDTFPLYYEAVENAGLCNMDIGDYEAALHCFEESININGNSFMTDFSIGECHQFMGDMKTARQWYAQAQNMPDQSQEQKDAVTAALAELAT